MLVKIADKEDPDQTASLENVFSCKPWDVATSNFAGA